jgi:cyclase
MKEIAPGIVIKTDYQGVNVAAIVMAQGIICVDAPSFPRDARHWVASLSQLHRWQVRYLILTDGHGDRVLNTRWLDAPIISHQYVAEKLKGYDRRYPQHLLDSLCQRNPNSGRDLTSGPVDRPAMSFSDTIVIVDDGMTVQIHSRPGPSPGNVWVYVPEAKILFTGDSVVNNTFPPLGEMVSRAWLEGLKALVAGDLAVDLIIPGRGEPAGREIAVPLVTFLEHMRSTLTRHIANQRPREEIAAYTDQFMDAFPLGSLPRDWVQRQLKLGLERSYLELQNEMMVTQVPPDNGSDR